MSSIGYKSPDVNYLRSIRWTSPDVRYLWSIGWSINYFTDNVVIRSRRNLMKKMVLLMFLMMVKNLAPCTGK